MLALSQDLAQNRPAEAREHVRRFHELFFTLSPEKSAIEHNVKRALLLSDKRATTTTRTSPRKVTTTASSRATSTRCCRSTGWSATSTATPTSAVTYAAQMIIRESNVTERSLVTACRLLNASRSDDNPERIHHRGLHDSREPRSTNHQKVSAHKKENRFCRLLDATIRTKLLLAWLEALPAAVCPRKHASASFWRFSACSPSVPSSPSAQAVYDIGQE